MNIHVEICSARYERQPVTIEKTVDGCKGVRSKHLGTAPFLEAVSCPARGCCKYWCLTFLVLYYTTRPSAFSCHCNYTQYNLPFNVSPFAPLHWHSLWILWTAQVSIKPHQQCAMATNCIKCSSSVLWALIGGPSSFAFFSPDNAKAEPANNVPRVAIESYINTRD